MLKDEVTTISHAINFVQLQEQKVDMQWVASLMLISPSINPFNCLRLISN